MSHLGAGSAQVGRLGPSSPRAGNAGLNGRPGAAAVYHAPSSPGLPSASGAGAPHLLSLKVMRISAPALAVTDLPYYEPDSGRNLDPVLDAVQSGVPTSFRQDLLTSAGTSSGIQWPISNVLTLPDSFGTIFLGETFRAYLCIRNESQLAMREPSLRIEMQIGDPAPSAEQSATGRVQLQYLIMEKPTSQDATGADVWELAPGSAMETTSVYDIKDLGPHVLVCTVGYKSPVSPPSGGGEVLWQERSFRKFYKFSVPTSPISVRTKVHNQRSPAATMHPDFQIRQQVALEVQVQNISGSSLVLEGLNLRPARGWTWNSIDRPSLTKPNAENKPGQPTLPLDMWTDANESLPDGDVRQYLFTLTPQSSGSYEQSAIQHGSSADGFQIVGDPIGNLDISWRMAQGEPGRLQTSQLLRRRVHTPPTPCARTTTTAKHAQPGCATDPKLAVQLTVRRDTLATLSAPIPGSEVRLGFSLSVDDRANSYVNSTSGEMSGMAAKEVGRAADEDTDDDDKPLSELAATSPGARARASRTVSASSMQALSLNDKKEPMTNLVKVRRVLRLAVQHCSVESHPLDTEGVALMEMTSAEQSRLTPDRSATPVSSSHASSGLLGRTRLQANLSNLVRNTSLSVTGANPLRRHHLQQQQRDSLDVGDTPDYRSSSPLAATPSRSTTPSVAPVPPSKSASEQQRQPQPHNGAVEAEAFLPPPVLDWTSVSRLYAVHVEAHAQALSRPPPTEAPLRVPTSLLPSQPTDSEDSRGPTAEFIGSSLVTLPDLELDLTLQRDPQTATPSAAHLDGCAQSSVDFDLSYAISAGHGDSDGVVRFGGLRILLLGWTDHLVDHDLSEGSEQSSPADEVKLKSAIMLQELLVIAEGVLE